MRKQLLPVLMAVTSGLAMACMASGAHDATGSTGNASFTQAITAVRYAPRPAQWAQPVPDTTIPNLYRITPSLYRSAQISARDIPALHQLGIRKVISLRAFHSDATLLKGSGIAIERIPLHTWDVEDGNIVMVLRAARHRSGRPDPDSLPARRGQNWPRISALPHGVSGMEQAGRA